MQKMNPSHAAALACMLLLAACTHELPLEERLARANYPDSIGSLMLSSCATSGCHNASAAAGGLDLSSWQAALRGSGFGAVVMPYAAQESHLFQHMNTYEELGLRASPVMPPDSSGPPLSREQVLRVADWIGSGALARDGSYYWKAAEQQAGGKVFALCSGSDLMAVFSQDSARIMRFVPVGQREGELESPHYAKVSPDGRFVYLTLIGGNLLEKYRSDTYALEGRLALGSSPSIILLSPDGSRALVSHWNDAAAEAKLSLIETASMTLLDELRADGDFLSYPHGMAATPGFDTLYLGANQGNYISRIRLSSSGFLEEEKLPLDPLGDPIPRPTQDYQPYQLFLSPDGSRLFISCSQKNEVWVMNPRTGALLKRIGVGKFPRLMSYDAPSGRLFVACRAEENFPQQGSMQGCISVIRLASMEWEQNLYRCGHRPHGIAVDAGRRLLYVSSENTGGADPPHHALSGNALPPGKLNVIDLGSLQVIRARETELAEFPSGVELTP
jgi:DNA-binding beta-propeller fold protein YncE